MKNKSNKKASKGQAYIDQEYVSGDEEEEERGIANLAYGLCTR